MAIKRENLSEQVVEYILAEIREEGLSPGDKLPSEKVLSDRLGVSRTVLREALRKLDTAGILSVKQGSGTFVTDNPAVNHLKNAIFPGIFLQSVSLQDLIQSRRAIETTTSGLAAERAEEAELESLREIVTEMEVAAENQDVDLFNEKDGEFHLFIAESSKNVILARMLKIIKDYMYEQHKELHSLPDLVHTSQSFHQRIYEAIQTRDTSRATEVMADHLDKVEEIFAEHELLDSELTTPEEGYRE